MSARAGSKGDPRSGSASRPWIVALIPAAAWFIHLNLSYLLVPTSCQADHPWWLVAVTLPAAAVAMWATGTSWRLLRAEGRRATDRTAALSGVLLGSLFLLGIASVGLSNVVVNPCR